MHKTRIYDFSKDFKIIRCVVNATRCPWNKPARGRPYEVEPKEYAALIVFMVSKDFSLREADSVSFLLLGKLLHRLIDCKGMKYVFIKHVKTSIAAERRYAFSFTLLIYWTGSVTISFLAQNRV